MDTSLVKIRLQQINQESGGLGSVHYLLLAMALVGVEYGLYAAYCTFHSALICVGVVNSLLLSIHLLRNDSKFLWHQLPNTQQKIFAEYWLLSIIFVLPALFTWQFWVVFPHLLWCFALAQWRFYRLKKRWVFPRLSSYLQPSKYLEWLSGIRQYGLVLVFIYLLSWVFCWLRGFPILALWFFTLLLANFYQEGEPLNILHIQFKTPKQYLGNKIKHAECLLLLLYTPQLLVNVFLHLDIWYIHFIFLWMQMVALLFLILSKYAIYQPNTQLKGNGVLQGVALIGTLIPYLAPLPLFLCFWYYPRAINQLKKYTPQI